VKRQEELEAVMLPDKETIQYLGIVAVLAAVAGMRKEAKTIADALIAARPDDENAQYIVAMAKIGAGEPEESAKILQDKILVKSPDNSLAKATLGLAYSLMGRNTDRDRLVQEVVDAGDNPEAINMTKVYMQAPAS
jgi:predicted Zn-dependent protease